MYESGLDQSSEGTRKEKWGITKLIIFPLTFISIFGIVFWLLFYSIILANLSFIIPLRNWYQSAFWNAGGILLPKLRPYPPLDPLYTFQVMRKGNGGYFFYATYGHFEHLDINQKLITLKGLDGDPYTFWIGNSISDDGLNILESQSSNSVEQKAYPFSSNQDVNIIFAGGSDLLEIFWADKRTLKQILDTYQKGRTNPVNQNYSASLIRYLKYKD